MDKDAIYKMLRENLETYGGDSGCADKGSGQCIKFNGKEIQSYFNADKTALLFLFFIQDHQTASLTLTLEASFVLMQMINQRLGEIVIVEGIE